MTPIDSGTNKGSRIKAFIERSRLSVDAGQEHVLHVNHADHFIEAFAEDGQTAVTRVDEGVHQVVEADVVRHGHDVAASHANVAGGLLAEVEEVAQHLTFGGGEIAGRSARGALALLCLVDRFLDLLAQGRFAILAEDQLTHPSPQA